MATRGYIHNGKYIKVSESHNDPNLEGRGMSSQYNDWRRERQREDRRRDIIQPYDKTGKPNRSFIEAYPDKAGQYFTADQIRNSERSV